MAHINKCVEDLLRKSGKKALGEHAAVWVPDAEANTCMHCHQLQFNMINRRHHCRKCGAVVCGPCSNKRYVLPVQSSKPLRVCLTCYDELTRARCGRPALNTSRGTGRHDPDTSQDSSPDDDEDSDDEHHDSTLSNNDDATFYGEVRH